MSFYISPSHVKALQKSRLQEAEARRQVHFENLEITVANHAVRHQLCAVCGLFLLNLGQRLLAAAQMPPPEPERDLLFE